MGESISKYSMQSVTFLLSYTFDTELHIQAKRTRVFMGLYYIHFLRDKKLVKQMLGLGKITKRACNNMRYQQNESGFHD